MTVRDLFGHEVDLQALWEKPLATKKSKRKPTPKRGHYFTPGTGPAGETCGSCQFIARRRLSKTYIKCGLNKGHWTGGNGSDIRVRDAACKFWKKAPG